MKVMSFSAIEILPALLKGMETNWKDGKNQTIRPAWKIFKKQTGVNRLSFPADAFEDIRNLEKQPRFQVGETVRLEWKSRNSPKGSYFCFKCGRKTTGKTDEWDNEVCPVHGGCDVFEKILGYGKITEVFKIEMRKDQTQSDGYGVKRLDRTLECFKDLWERDGFTDAETMFSWFDSHYDLKTPKTFWVYRWERNKEHR